MPLAGGAPSSRGTAVARRACQGWTPDGKVLYSTTRFSGKPGSRLYARPATGEEGAWPLSDAAGLACWGAI